MVLTIEQNTEFLRMNSQQIAKHLEHINWNLGKIAAHLTNDKETVKKIIEAEKEEDGN